MSLREIFIFGCVVTAGDASGAALSSRVGAFVAFVVVPLASIFLGTVAVLIARKRSEP